MAVRYQWRGEFTSTEIDALHAEGFGHEPTRRDWKAQLGQHSLGWVCARQDRLVGFVNVSWDGSGHAFIIDTVVARDHRRHAIGQQLVAAAVRQATAAGCEWLHVDFEGHLRAFYIDACGFSPTMAGLLRLGDQSLKRTSI